VASGSISAAQVDRLGVMFGRGAGDRAVIERAWVLESQLRKLADVGTDPAEPTSTALRVVALSQRVGALEGGVLAAYLGATLTHAVCAKPSVRPWRHTVFVLGADRLRGDVLDRLCGACESTGTGLVLAFRSVPPRLGRGNAAIAFMRPGDAEDAKAASEQIGTGHHFVLSQLIDAIGRSVGETTASRYTGTADTVWAKATVEAADGDKSLAIRRSRELVVDQHELQRLPPSAMIISYPGRQVVLADANPGIGGLPAATE
jgi:hypothetical protein